MRKIIKGSMLDGIIIRRQYLLDNVLRKGINIIGGFTTVNKSEVAVAYLATTWQAEELHGVPHFATREFPLHVLIPALERWGHNREDIKKALPFLNAKERRFLTTGSPDKQAPDHDDSLQSAAERIDNV